MPDNKVIYKGHGFFIGLPCRDMTLQEWREYPEKLTKAAEKAGVFEIVTDKEVTHDK